MLKRVVFIGVLSGGLVLLIALNVQRHIRLHSVDDAEDRRRWLREMAEDNAKSGLIRDTNGAWIYVGTTNVQLTPKQKPGK
jgi:hypothetical protein